MSGAAMAGFSWAGQRVRLGGRLLLGQGENGACMIERTGPWLLKTENGVLACKNRERGLVKTENEALAFKNRERGLGF